MSLFDPRFALVDSDGNKRYPHKKSQKETNRYGYALSHQGNPDRRGGGVYTLDLEEVVRRTVHDGWGVRAKVLNKATGVLNPESNTVQIGAEAIVGYEISEDLLRLVSGAKQQPIRVLPIAR